MFIPIFYFVCDFQKCRSHALRHVKKNYNREPRLTSESIHQHLH